MIFSIFIIVAGWLLPLPIWLKVCLTIFGALHAIYFAMMLFGDLETKK